MAPFSGDDRSNSTTPHLNRDFAIDHMRITSWSNQGGRRYMEDSIAVHCERFPDGRLRYVYIGVFDGHGGQDASEYARNHLLKNIVSQESFESENDADVLNAIREGFIQTHHDMWKEVEKWPKTASGYTSTAGTTATVAFLMNGKIFTGHVGDSAAVLGEIENGVLAAKRLTIDHKPDSPDELKRIEETGGEVMRKAGVVRVVWHRPRRGHQGPIRRSTAIDKIPFLAVARALGDLWSYNSALDQFIVSPTPDVDVVKCDGRQACLILGSDGLWNVVRAGDAVSIVNSHEWKELEQETDSLSHRDANGHPNVAKQLIRHALMRWGQLRADNISAICVVFDSPNSKYVASSGCVDRVLKYPYQLNEILEDSPESMMRIGPNSMHLLRTMPVELVYFGQTDYGVTFGERRNIVTSADEFASRTTEFAGTFTFDSRDDGAGGRKEDEYGYFSFSSETVRLRSLKEESAGSGAEETPAKPRYFCSKHGLTCEKVKRMNRIAAAANEQSTAAPNEPGKTLPSTSSTGVGEQRPRYWCRKHGLSCSKVKRMNEEWLRQRLLESSPPPVAPPVAEFLSSPEPDDPDDPAPTPASAPKSAACSTGKLRKHHRYAKQTFPYSSLMPRYNLRDHVRTTRSGLRLSSPVKSTANRSKARALKRLSLPARRPGDQLALNNVSDRVNKSMPTAMSSASTSSFVTTSCLSKVRQDLKKSVHQFRVKHFKRQISGNSNSTDAVSLSRWRERHSSGAYEFDQETYIINSLNLDLGGVIAERTRRKTSDMMLLAADSANEGQSNARKRKIALDDDAVVLEGQRKRSRLMGYCLRARTIE